MLLANNFELAYRVCHVPKERERPRSLSLGTHSPFQGARAWRVIASPADPTPESSVAYFPSNKSGRFVFVRSKACSLRHLAIFPWSPESRMSGTLMPRHSAGRV